MGKMVKTKKLIAVLMTLIMLLSMSVCVFADEFIPGQSTLVSGTGGSGSSQSSNDNGDKPDLIVVPVDPWSTMNFRVHASGSYADLGGCVIKFNTNTMSGSIRLSVKITYTASNGKKVTLPAGTTWTFKISSFKEGGKITLKFDKANSPSSAASLVKKYNLTTMTGKIHRDTFRQAFTFWKIDCLGCGFYFRDN